MRCKNRIFEICSSKSGASLMFVMGIMLLLLAVGGSLLAAASANYGSNIRQNQYNAAVVLNNSIQSNIRHSLQIPATNPGFENSLASNLARAVYDASIEGESLTMFELNLGNVPGLVTVEANRNARVTLLFSAQHVHITPARDAMPEFPPPDPLGFRAPRTAIISARMIVEVIVDAGTANDARVITTRAIYEYSGVMSDAGTWDETQTPSGIMNFVKNSANPNDTADPGQWVMVSYEISE